MTDVDAVVAQARALLAAGDAGAADHALARALHDAPGTPELLYLRGVVAGRRGDHLAAMTWLQEALALRPGMTLAWLALGHARMRLQQFGAGRAAYAEAAALEPDAADAHFNLGIAHRRLADLPAAARCFYRAWQREPLLLEAGRACVDTLGLLARSGCAAPSQPLLTLPPSPPAISVVVCSIDDGKATRVREMFERLLAGVPHEIQVLRDARSLAEAYQRGIAASIGEVVVLAHDDIDILAVDFVARLLRHLETCDVLGSVGATRMSGPVPIWAGHPHVRGGIVHRAPDEADWQVDLADWRPLSDGVCVLDGVLLAARRTVLDRIPFDAVTFDGFHGYDVDWSCRAAQAGYRLAAAADLRLVHASRGRYDATWQHYAERLCAKHRLPAPDPGPVPFHSTRLGSATEVGRFFDWLLDIAAAEPPPSLGSGQDFKV